MGLIIDAREAKLIAKFALMKTNIVVKQLPVADAIVENSSGSHVLLVERKTFSDFCSSLTSGRYEEQRNRLIAVRTAHPLTKIAYFLEGFPDWHNKLSYEKSKDANIEKRINGAIENLVFKHSIPIYPTVDVAHTCETLVHLEAKLSAERTSLSPGSVPMPARKVTIKEHLFPSQLAMIPGISNDTALSITKFYSSPKKLVDAIATSRDRVIEELSNHAPKKRKIGRTPALAIVNAFS